MPEPDQGLLNLIGNTPLIPLSHLAPEGGAAIYAKCEQFNPGGSVKDRICLSMVAAAEEEGLIGPGSVIIEPTSGNTGIGLALVAAVRGYRLILTMPRSYSVERRYLLQAFGTELVLTPEDEHMKGAIDRARELVEENDHYFMPQQFSNPANPEAHRCSTWPEIEAALGGAQGIDLFVAGVGTGGTLTGVGSCLKAAHPEARVVAVEPASSAVLSGQDPGPHMIQGIGAGFVPPVLDRSLIDQVEQVADLEAWQVMRRLAREEGLLVGISAGANVAAALRLAAELPPSARVVTILPDTGQRYLSLEEHFASLA